MSDWTVCPACFHAFPLADTAIEGTELACAECGTTLVVQGDWRKVERIPLDADGDREEDGDGL